MNRYLRNKQGSALIVVLMVTLVLIIMGTAVLNFSMSDGRNAVYQEKSTQAYYVAKSGAQVTVKKVDNILENNIPEDMDELIALLPDYSGTITGQGKFDITYDDSRKSEDMIKIVSEGARASSNVSDIVTLLMKISFPLPTAADNGGWLNGHILFHNISPTDADESHIGSIVDLVPNSGGLVVKSPQNPGSTPIYQASVIRLAAGDPSIVKAMNSCAVTFDTEIIYFKNDIRDEDNKNDNMFLTISDDVVEDDRLSSYDTGFENYDRYEEFAGPYDGVTEGGITYELKPDGHYTFVSGKHYGLTYFGGGVFSDTGTEIIPVGYYFYPEDFHLFASDALTKLIEIDSDDAIILALEGMFSPHADSEDYIWGRN